MATKPQRSVAVLDDAAVTAVTILNEAIKDSRIPGVNEFMVVTSALQRAIDSRRSGDLMVAEAAFDQLDGETRAGIAERAIDRAEDYRRAAGPVVIKAPVDPTIADGQAGVPRPPARPSTRAPSAPSMPGLRNKSPSINGAPLLSAMTGLLRNKKPF